jgi:hypothetical protein
VFVFVKCSCRMREEGRDAVTKAVCRRRFIVKCRIGINATDCTSSMPNALKSNAELNAKLNACMQARGIRKCYSYGVRCNIIILLVYLHSLVLGHVTLCHVTALVRIR